MKYIQLKTFNALFTEFYFLITTLHSCLRCKTKCFELLCGSRPIQSSLTNGQARRWLQLACAAGEGDSRLWMALDLALEAEFPTFLYCSICQALRERWPLPWPSTGCLGEGRFRAKLDHTHKIRYVCAYVFNYLIYL